MRKSDIFISVITIALSGIVPVKAANEEISADAFVVALVRDIALGSSCRDEYDPGPVVNQHPMRDGKMKKWEEKDRREPDIINHLIEWKFPGIILTTSTHFDWYGPSTWLYSIRLSSPSTLPPPLSFGLQSADILDSLGITRLKSGPRQLWYESAYVTLEFGENGRLKEVLLECIAD